MNIEDIRVGHEYIIDAETEGHPNAVVLERLNGGRVVVHTVHTDNVEVTLCAEDVWRHGTHHFYLNAESLVSLVNPQKILP